MDYTLPNRFTLYRYGSTIRESLILNLCTFLSHEIVFSSSTSRCHSLPYSVRPGFSTLKIKSTFVSGTPSLLLSFITTHLGVPTWSRLNYRILKDNDYCLVYSTVERSREGTLCRQDTKERSLNKFIPGQSESDS